MEEWSLTSLLVEKVVKIGAKVIGHGRYAIFQMAEVAEQLVLTLEGWNGRRPGVELRPACVLGVPSSGRKPPGDDLDPRGGRRGPLSPAQKAENLAFEATTYLCVDGACRSRLERQARRRNLWLQAKRSGNIH